MEKLIDVVIAIGNWWDNTTPRDLDPDELVTLKRSERFSALYSVVSLILFVIALSVERDVPEATGYMLPFATIHAFILKGILLAPVASIGMLLFHLARGAWAYRCLNHD
ncbi:hypothetical protein AU476_19220 [Cupriavidus sp. UYMSc13B]|nr:hypothetical protein AU476_19220 [Cupriavidus sp. UYMSc13B]